MRIFMAVLAFLLLTAPLSAQAVDKELEIDGKTYVTDGNGLWNMSGNRVRDIDSLDI